MVCMVRKRQSVWAAENKRIDKEIFMKRISKYAALLAALAGLLIAGCDSGDDGGNEPSSPLTVTNGTVVSCDRTTKGTVEIPSDVTAIGDYAFGGCTGLTEVSIPSSVRSVGQNAFAGCHNLTVRYAGTKKEWERLGVDTKHVTVVCRDGTVGESDEGQGENPVTYYTVTFYPNVPQDAVGGGLSSVSRTYSASSMAQIPDDLFVLDGYRLVGWATNAGDSTVSYYTGNNFDVWDDMSFYAVWEKDALWQTTIDGISYYHCLDEGNDYWVVRGAVQEITEASIKSEIDGIPVTCIDTKAFYQSSNLTTVTIPDGVTSIGEYAFYECQNMTSITIPNSVVSIGRSAFYGCSSLHNVMIPLNVTYIELGTFSGCSSLENIMIPDNVTFIGQSAFYDCNSLTSITIPDGVTNIGNYAFHGCSGLTRMNIPASVTTIGDSVFVDCSSLASITVDDSNPSYSSQDGILYNKYKTSLIYVPQAIRSIAIIDSVTYIAENAFYGCKYLTSVKIPSKVTSIGKGAFSGCRSLQEMTLPFVGSSVSKYATTTYLGYIFGGTDNTAVPSSLKVVRILDGMTTIKKNAFSGCSGLVSVTIPDTVTSIENGAFSGCSNLTEMTLPFAGATKDGTDNTYFDYIFGGTTSYSGSSSYNSLVPQSLKKVTITGTVGDYAFMKCKGLTSVTIGSRASSIGTYAFYGCNGITSLTIENGVSSIGSWAFRDCKGLTSLILPSSVTFIGARAFNMCEGLTTVTMTASLQVIGDSAFSGCMALMNIIFKGTPAQWASIEKGSYWDYSTGGVSGYYYDHKFYTVTYEY